MTNRDGNAKRHAIKNRSGRIVCSGKNLAVFLRHARTAPIQHVRITRRVDHSGDLYVKYTNGDSGRVRFGAYSTLCDWLAVRKTWANVPVFIGGRRRSAGRLQIGEDFLLTEKRRYA